MTLRRTPLKRKTPLSRGTSKLARKTRLKQRRAKPRRSSRVRDPKHLAFVKSLPCCAPGCTRQAPSEAHHDTEKRGLGQKADDTRSLPLCRADHDGAQHYRGRFKGWDKDQMRAWFEEQLSRVMALKEEQVRLTELPKEDVEFILGLIEDKETNLRDVLPRTEGTLAKSIVEAGITRCAELAERIRGAA